MPSATIGRKIDEGLELYCPLNEGAGTKIHDHSLNARQATLDLGTSNIGDFWANTWLDKPVATFKALDEKIDFTSFNLNEITMACWANWTAFQDTTYEAFIFKANSGDPSQSTAFSLGAFWSSPSFRMCVTTDNNNGEYAANTSMEIGAWHNYVGSYTDGDMRLYIDGKLIYIDPSPPTGDIEDVDSPFRIGMGAQGDSINALLCEVRIYNRALSEQEIRTLYDMRRRI